MLIGIFLFLNNLLSADQFLIVFNQLFQPFDVFTAQADFREKALIIAQSMHV